VLKRLTSGLNDRKSNHLADLCRRLVQQGEASPNPDGFVDFFVFSSRLTSYNSITTLNLARNENRDTNCLENQKQRDYEEKSND
jgi:hypothetical protein